MFYIKRKVIDLDIQKILTKPLNKTLSNKKYVCYFKALVRYPLDKAEGKYLLASMVLDIISPPYTLPLWLLLWKKYKYDPLSIMDFLKLWGYPYKPNRDRVAFYVLEATERQLNINYKKHKDTNTQKHKEQYQKGLNILINSNYVGVDYLKSKYPELRSNDRVNDYNKLTNYFLTKNNGKDAVLWYPKDLTQRVNLILLNDLHKITNPNNKKILEDKPLFYQLIDTQADIIKKDAPELDKKTIIKTLLANNTFKAQKHQSTN